MSIYTQTKSLLRVPFCSCARVRLPKRRRALVQQALQRNPELNFFVAEIAAAKGAVRTAGTVRNPELSSELATRIRAKIQEERAAMARYWLSLSAKPSSTRVELRCAKRLRITICVVAELHLQQFRLTLAARVRSLAYATKQRSRKNESGAGSHLANSSAQ